jgi:putative ATP-dependent endonuclease of the OLD family
MLTRLKIQNYRCLENIDLPFSPLTALVGPNGSGKTSVLRALSCLFGEAWPSLRSFRIPQDFTDFDTRRPVEITGWFNPPYVHEDALKKKHEILAVRLSCRPYKTSGRWGEAGDLHADLEPLNAKGEVPFVATTPPKKGIPPSFRPLSATGDLREYTKLLFVDHRRSLAQHLPTIRGSILGRLLEPARQKFSRQDDFKNAYEAALDILRTDTVREIEEKIRETAKRMLGFLGREASKNLDIGLGFADPANPFNSLRLEYRESGRGFPGDELGLGIQSAVVVGIFEAFRQIGGDIQSVVIEEPEMYLHPQAQRYFYRLLCEMAETKSSQVIYSTHSPIFADVNRFEGLRLVRREASKNSVSSYIRPAEFKALSDERDRQKLAGRFDPTRNEVLFASRALLVEGHADRAGALLVAEKLEADVDAEAVAIVDCGGKNGIPLVARVCKSLEIPFAVLHDEDVWPLENVEDKAKQKEENRSAEADNRRISDAVGTNGPLFVAKPTLEAMLGIGRSAKDKPFKVVEKLRDMKLSEVPQPLLDAVKTVLPPEPSQKTEAVSHAEK